MRLKTTIFLLGLTLSLSGQAQHYMHSTFWMHGIVTAPLSKKWDTNVDYIHRLQNDIGSQNPFTHASLAQLRFWENYKYKNWLFQLNPFSYIVSSQYLGKLSDYNVKPNLEYRFAVSAEVKQTAGKWTFKERGQYEYRVLRSLNYGGTARARARFLAQYVITDKTKCSFSEEYWFNVPPRKVPNVFDQNWILVNVSQQVSKKLAIELGYRRNIRERNTLKEFDEENGLEVAANLKF
jgi:hypothetical protein